MAGSLQTAVLGMRAYQPMLDVAGNNIANADTIGYKESRVTFADIFARTLRPGAEGSGVTGGGGTSPIQVGQGVVVSGIDKNMNQGGFTSTEKAFDVAMDGDGFFVVNNGKGLLYTRDGSFDVDANGLLVDAASGYTVERIGTIGEDDNFQTPGSTTIKVPYKT